MEKMMVTMWELLKTLKSFQNKGGKSLDFPLKCQFPHSMKKRNIKFLYFFLTKWGI